MVDVGAGHLQVGLGFEVLAVGDVQERVAVIL
jgi:hypothetical protein